jgi:hypothetical protein
VISPGTVRATLLVVGLMSAMTGPVAAEHEVFYRYVVLGYVKDVGGAPIGRAQVELVRDKTGFSYLGETGADGFFLLIARLGDESVGERLTLRMGKVATAITARFDPADHAAHRGTRVDLLGGAFQERAASFTTTLARFLGTAPR